MPGRYAHWEGGSPSANLMEVKVSEAQGRRCKAGLKEAWSKDAESSRESGACFESIVFLPMPPPAGANAMTLARSNPFGGLHFGQKDLAALAVQIVSTDPAVTWQIKMTRPGGGNLQEDPVKKVMEVEDVILILGYEWE